MDDLSRSEVIQNPADLTDHSLCLCLQFKNTVYGLWSLPAPMMECCVWWKRGNGEGGQKLGVGNEGMFTVLRDLNRISSWWVSNKFESFVRRETLI